MSKYSFLKEDTQLKHVAVMECIAQEIATQANDNFVLKGGTALLLVHNLKRFSTDLDFDGKNPTTDIQNAVEKGLAKAGATQLAISCVKNTDTVKRYKVHYEGNPENPLKVEISYRNPILAQDVEKTNGIYVYNLTKLTEQKTAAFVNRLSARDIYDIAFLLENHSDKFSLPLLERIQSKVDNVGIDYLATAMNEDSLIASTCDPVAATLGLDARVASLLSEYEQTSQNERVKAQEVKPQQKNLSFNQMVDKAKAEAKDHNEKLSTRTHIDAPDR